MNITKKIAERITLKDDATETGGISYIGKTLDNFMVEAGVPFGSSLKRVNKALVECGIEPLINHNVGLSQLIVSIAEQDGETGVRLCVGDTDIFIEAHDIDEDGKEFKWDEAMKKLKAYGKRTFDKHEMYLIAAFKDEINAALREIGGDELDTYYWSSTEYSSASAWYVNFSSGYIYGDLKYNTLVVRPVAAFKHE